uniref:Uncharacterized protein LOC111136330 isoform X2 n=1 Tax=Crassostrea virginica TaxID=6565 RepID=A0A8B8ESB6_CRAVI|nr:uncharacterized protein LOC111136330 isoform X2 [Crassostrea virginica]
MAFIVESVDRCPRDEFEWEERAILFNCTVLVMQTLIARKSNTTELLNYMYHCVLTGDGDRLVEVCAPSVNIHGNSCTEFNLFGKRIQESFLNCTGVCPDVYNSKEAYKYQTCYDQASQPNESNVISIVGAEETTSSYLYAAVLFCCGFVIGNLIVLTFVRRNIIKKKIIEIFIRMRIFLSDASYSAATEDANAVTKHQANVQLIDNNNTTVGLKETVDLENLKKTVHIKRPVDLEIKESFESLKAF